MNKQRLDHYEANYGPCLLKGISHHKEDALCNKNYYYDIELACVFFDDVVVEASILAQFLPH